MSDELRDDCDVMLAAIGQLQPESKCNECDWDVGFECPLCALIRIAMNLRRQYLANRPRWTDAMPTSEGWWAWRDSTESIREVRLINGKLCGFDWWDGMDYENDSVWTPLAQLGGQWSDRPVVMPEGSV